MFQQQRNTIFAVAVAADGKAAVALLSTELASERAINAAAAAADYRRQASERERQTDIEAVDGANPSARLWNDKPDLSSPAISL